MKKVRIAAAVLLLACASSAQAATTVTVKTINKSFSANNAEGFTLSNANAVTFTNTHNATNDVVVTALDSAGALVWNKTIDSGVDEIATAMTSDTQGNIWIAGSAAVLLSIETPTSVIGVENPDSVTVENSTPLRPDMMTLSIWKLSPAGVLLSTFRLEVGSVPLVNALDVDLQGISVAGVLADRPFILNCDLAGKFSKVINIGTALTIFNEISRTKSGLVNIYGSSSETLAGKKRVGTRDGILMTISSAGKITQLVRSSAGKATRDWQSATNTYATTGSVRVSSTIESAITQFTSAFKPVWTLRLPSTGESRITYGNKLTYLAFTSKTKITGITGWKPSQPTLMLIAFDSKGDMKAAYSFPGLTSPISLEYSQERGVTGLAFGAKNTVSIFQLN